MISVKQETLNKLQIVASIFSSVGIPLAIALVGWWVQASISDESIKKDYVQISIGILLNDKVKDEDLRKWAINVLSKNSPVPFSSELKSKLVSREISIYAWRKIPEPPQELMGAPLELLELNKENESENSKRLKMNQEKIRQLQAWILQESKKEYEPSWLIPKNAVPYGSLSDEEWRRSKVFEGFHQ